jgi:phage terminase large subunit-like protein
VKTDQVPSGDSWRKLDVAAKMRLRWRLKARPNQLTPNPHALCCQPVEACEKALTEAKKIRNDPLKRAAFLKERGHYGWSTWLLLMGRGGGKTRSGAEDIAKFMIENPGSRIALVAATFADGKLVMVEGESGLKSVLPAKWILSWNRSMGELVLINGSQAKIYSAEDPDQLRGPQFHRAWADELAAWTRLDDTWMNLRMALRLGDDPKVIVTTTPRPLPFIRERVTKAEKPEGAIVLSTGSTLENAANLAPPMLAELLETYEGTRIGRQELYGEVLEDMEGALWNLAMIEDGRLPLWALPDPMRALGRTVVAIDPAGTSNDESDETGIVTVALTRGPCPFCDRAEKPHGVVLEDNSGRYSPREWALEAKSAYDRWQADRIVAETNYGGDLVVANLTAAALNLPISKVTAKKGKRTRAEPVFALYERMVVHHWSGSNLSVLEKQMCSWEPEEKNQKSPDRVDALVYAVTELMLPKQGLSAGVKDNRHAGRR